MMPGSMLRPYALTHSPSAAWQPNYAEAAAGLNSER
jgi:hypothetical protein